jgi:hypothetical protein
LFFELIHHNRIYNRYPTRQTISTWLDTQGHRFDTYRHDGTYNFLEISELTYADYMSIFEYLDENLFDAPIAIISALSNQIFKDFFGLP